MKSLIAFFEIPSADFSRAVGFYEAVFGWELSVFECEQEKMACIMQQGESVGAIFYAPDFFPSPHGVLIDLRVEDIENTLAKVVSHGGKTVIPKTKIEAEGKGWFAVFEDSEGNRVGLYAD